jgi:D-arabinose 1-dehydrogenase-like Zn-dependent alcohol dehydrogenase
VVEEVEPGVTRFQPGDEVYGMPSAAKHDLVASLGADELIDYRATNFAAHVDGVDVVLDTVAMPSPGAPSACCTSAACWSRSWAVATSISPRAPGPRAAVSRA